MWNYVGGIIAPKVGSVSTACATWAGGNITPVLCVDAHVVFYAFSLCLLIGFVAHDLHHSVVVVRRLFVPHCDVDAYSTHAQHTSITVVRSSSSHL
jgi:hypothetical protein